MTETVAKVEEKLDKMDGAKKELTLKMADVEKVRQSSQLVRHSLGLPLLSR